MDRSTAQSSHSLACCQVLAVLSVLSEAAAVLIRTRPTGHGSKVLINGLPWTSKISLAAAEFVSVIGIPVLCWSVLSCPRTCLKTSRRL